MAKESRLVRIAPDELPKLLTRLYDEQATDLVLIGPKVLLSPLANDWPKDLQGGVVYQLTGKLPGLPPELARLRRLQRLSLWALDLEESDAAFIAEHLNQLTSLNLWNNNVGDAGARAIAAHLRQITSLTLSSNNVGKAGARAIAAQLRQLTSLDLGGNKVCDAGARAIAAHLHHLISLNLSDNNVGKAGASAIAKHLYQLTSLDLGGNSVGEAGAIAIAEHLQQLTSLSLWNSKVGEAGTIAIAAHLLQLTLLDLGGNNVGDAGARAIAANLRQITSLNLSHNNVGEAGAHAIAAQLRQLTSLDLGGNKVDEAGAIAIAEHLQQLTSLDLGGNKVGEAGAIAEHLHQLTSLSLWNSKVGEAGAIAIAEHLRQLTLLNLNGNKVGEAGTRAISEHLDQLKSLYLIGNGVGDDAVAAIGQQLQCLETLDLRCNPLTTVAPLAQLQALKTLNVATTQVQDLSPLSVPILAGLPVKWFELGLVPGIFVKDCPLTHPSPEIVRQGSEAVRNYFREIEAQGTDRLFEAKLLIVGEGGAGKTSLLRRLFLPDQDLPSEDQTTRGIDIHCHEFPLADGRRFRLNAWDFGGQQIYHATHQFFLTKRSLYVLVDDTRSDNESIHDEGFRFWLEVVETLSENSPLLIFQNEKGGRSKQIDAAGIKGRYANVQAVHHGNLEHSGSTDDLRSAVEYFAQHLPHIGEDVPAKWVSIRQDLEALAQSRQYISLDEYFEVYGRHLELDREKALHLSQYLHDLGVFLHFQQPRELRRTVFLQNQWVTEAVFRVLDDEGVKARRGRFTLADCDRLWADEGYAAKELELRALMVRFELCYRLPDMSEETWLVPQHLSPSKPAELNDWAQPGDLMLIYRYGFLPRGLVSRLMVRMHRFVRQPDLCWSQGALFEHGETQVLVETTARGNEISLRSRGPERQALLSVIASDLDALNDGFPGLKDKVGKWVPCVCATCAGLTEPALFAQKDLIDRRHRGKLTIECPKPDYADVSVPKLLDGMDLDKWLEQASKTLPPDRGDAATAAATSPSAPQRSENIKTIRIFLASSSELRDDRDAFELYFRQQNDRLHKQGLYLEIVRWENFLDALSNTRKQDDYNQAIRDCDLFVSLFKTKTGKYTEEEFDIAHQTFKDTGKPLIWTYFQKANISNSATNRAALTSLWDFQKKLSDLGHFQTEYESIEGLKSHFRDQLDKLQKDF